MYYLTYRIYQNNIYQLEQLHVNCIRQILEQSFQLYMAGSRNEYEKNMYVKKMKNVLAKPIYAQIE